MAQENFYITQGDSRPPLEMTCRDADDVVVDITGNTSLKFSMWNMDSNLLVVDDASATEIDASNGRVDFLWGGTTTDKHGKFRCELEVTFGDGTIETFPNNDANPVVVHIRRRGA